MSNDSENGCNGDNGMNAPPENVKNFIADRAKHANIKAATRSATVANASAKRAANVLGCTNALRWDEALIGLLAYDEFSDKVFISRPPPALRDGDKVARGPYPREFNDDDLILVQVHLQAAWAGGIKKSDLFDAARQVGKAAPFHQVCDWLVGLDWDGVLRLDRWLFRAYGLESRSPDIDAYHESVGAVLLIGAVRRVRQPGCKFDTMLVLEGKQGIGKSRSMRLMFGPWFSDSMPSDLASKDAMINLRGVWCVELAEIGQMRRSEVEAFKAFLASQVDNYRPPYSKTARDFPRQCVLVGTTNSDEYLRDTTGNRRFWPIKCREVNMAWLEDNREQLWAEAAAREASGEVCWLETPEALAGAALVQSERVETDLWDEPIRDFLRDRNLASVTIPQILSEKFLIAVEKHDGTDKHRIAQILRRFGWVSDVRWDKSSKQRLRKWWRSDSQ